MPADRDLECRRLTAGEDGLLEGLLSLPRGNAECLGLEEAGAFAEVARVWGVFIRGVLGGAAVLRDGRPGEAPAAALLVSSRWRGLGLAALLLDCLSREAGEAGAPEIRARLAGGPPELGRLLEEAGFSGPPDNAESYPAGEWRRSAERRPDGR